MSLKALISRYFNQTKSGCGTLEWIKGNFSEKSRLLTAAWSQEIWPQELTDYKFLTDKGRGGTSS